MDLDDSFDIKASFQVVPEKRYDVPRQFVDAIQSRGFEFGIQDLNHDGKLFDNKQEFLRRAAKINAYGAQYGARSFRAAILYRRPDWLSELNFSVDMSIPNVAHLDPQRGGCCTVMPFFIGDVLELPVTTVQDYTLFHILNDRSIDLWKMQLNVILGKNGLASFVVHPDYLLDSSYRSAYISLLQHLRSLRAEQHLWTALPGEIESWWRARSKMSVCRVGNSWRVTGQGSERGVVAWARNVSGKLIYDVPGNQSASGFVTSNSKNWGQNDTV
jgi:hypothetical protein